MTNRNIARRAFAATATGLVTLSVSLVPFSATASARALAPTSGKCPAVKCSPKGRSTVAAKPNGGGGSGDADAKCKALGQLVQSDYSNAQYEIQGAAPGNEYTQRYERDLQYFNKYNCAPAYLSA